MQKMAEACAFLSVDCNNVKCLVSNRELRKQEKVQKLSSKGWGKFISISKPWTTVKPIGYE